MLLHERTIASSPATRPQCRVLIVEDSWIVAQNYAAIIEAIDLQTVGPVATAADALAVLDTEDFEIALVDLNLDGGTAHDAIEALRARRIPVIVVSGHDVPQGLDQSIHSTLKKPIRAHELIAAIRSATAQATVGAEA